jgi:hypothetical protein
VGENGDLANYVRLRHPTILCGREGEIREQPRPHRTYGVWIIRQWRKDWEIRKLMAKHAKLDIALPSGGMSPIGYVAIKFSIMKQKPTKAFQHWIDAMPAEYRTSISEAQHPTRT